MAPWCAATEMFVAVQLTCQSARCDMSARLAQSLPMGLCRALRDCVLVLGLRLMQWDGGGWWRMAADGGGWRRMAADGGARDSQIVIWPKK